MAAPIVIGLWRLPMSFWMWAGGSVGGADAVYLLRPKQRDAAER